MDIAVEIVRIEPPINAAPGSRRHAARWQFGDIVNILPADQIGTKQGNSWTPRGVPKRTGYLFVNGVPDIELWRVKRIVMRKCRLPEPGEELFEYPRTFTARRTEWRCPPFGFATQVLNRFNADGYTTVNWGQAKSMIRKRAITLATDPTLDDETRELTDADIV